MRSISPRISVPLPTPDGPVITNTRATARNPSAASGGSGLAVQQRNKLAALALGQAADRLARRDAAVHEDLVDLHAPVLGHREQHVEDLGGLDVFGRVEQQRVNRQAPRLEVALELSPLYAYLICPCKRVHSLV